MDTWPDDFFKFAYVPDLAEKLKGLAEKSEKEDWAYHHTDSDYDYPILYNYIRYTYKRLAEERKIVISDDVQFSCFNTGLVTPNQEPLFASYEVNRASDASQHWYFKGWYRRGQRELNKFSELPELAQYFDDPSALVFDNRLDVRINVEHIIEENKERFPEPYKSMDNYSLQTSLKGLIDNVKERVKRSYKTAIPQYYKGYIQLLLPLCLISPQRADLALVVEKHDTFYRASTCLTIDMAYNNARQLCRPDRDWLQP